MADIGHATERWDDLLVRFAERDVERLLNAQHERGLLKYDRPVCMVARPHFVGEGEYARHRQVVRVLSNALRKARDYLVADRAREAEHLGKFYDWIGDLVHLEPAGADHGAITRLDAFRKTSDLNFIELNADCPGGTDHNDALASIFADMETFRAMEMEFGLRALLLQPAMAGAFVDAWRDWGGTGAPRVAAVGWFDRIGTTADAVLHGARPLLEHGIGSIVAVDPSALAFDGQRLTADGAPVDVVYRMMLTRDVLSSLDELGPLLAALRQQAVCMVNPFRSELMGHKALFALITDPDVDLGLDSTDQDIIREHVPWGRLLREASSTDPGGKRIDLVAYVIANQNDLVLKPTHEAKGDGVELGWRHSPSAWEAAIRAALESDYIVQKRVPTERVSYPVVEPGVPSKAVYEDTDPFVCRGDLAGFLTRLSEAEIVNVAKGGSVVPTFVVQG